MNNELLEDIEQVILAINNGDLEDAKSLLEEMKDVWVEYNFNFFPN
jgi:pentatricopeptide repeat protein